ncbi:MAG TPA: hypothetical protein PK852_02535 [Mesotoga prima]|uniref:hypothetical protein n=1 Tax=Mesotoga prima TaxID=1184387 RepID=UPI002BC9438C|nr:hypothetical protein [Mesotoga prima]HPE52972.1 hypothetical protein [Mesotoga prima]
MKSFIELNPYDARDLMNALRSQEKNGGIRKLRIAIEAEGVKFKINENMWSPPMGKEVQAG